MKKKIKRYGGSLVIQFSSEECCIYDLKEGEVYNIEISPVGKNGS